MKFGTIHTPHWDEGITQEQVLRQTADRMVRAESLGFWSAWTTEHHFGNDPTYLPYGARDRQVLAYDVVADPMTLLAYVAARTTRLRLGTGVMVLHFHHPVHVAERTAMVDLLSGGRLELGVGRGSGYNEPLFFGVPDVVADNQDKFYEELDLLLKAWTGRRFSHKGNYFDTPEVSIVPSPLQRPHPPVYLSNRSLRSLDYAADHGLSYAAVSATASGIDIQRHNESHQKFVDRSRVAGHDISNNLYPNTIHLYCSESQAEAEDVAEAALVNFGVHGATHYEFGRRDAVDSKADAGFATGLPMFKDMSGLHQRARGQMETNLVGTPKVVAEKLTAMTERIPSMNYVMVITEAGTPPAAFVDRSMELFATQVMPKFVNYLAPALADG